MQFVLAACALATLDDSVHSAHSLSSDPPTQANKEDALASLRMAIPPIDEEDEEEEEED